MGRPPLLLAPGTEQNVPRRNESRTTTLGLVQMNYDARGTPRRVPFRGDPRRCGQVKEPLTLSIILSLNLDAIEAAARARAITTRASLLARLGVPALDPVTPHLIAALHDTLGIDLRAICSVRRGDLASGTPPGLRDAA